MRRPAVALLAVAALLAGCGSGDEAPSQPSKARRDYERALRGVVAQVREASDTARGAAARPRSACAESARRGRSRDPHRDLTAGFAAVAKARATRHRGAGRGGRPRPRGAPRLRGAPL